MTRGLLLAAAAVPLPLAAETRFEPSVDTRAVVSYSSDQAPETRAWNEVAAGLSAGIDTRRIDFDLRYRYAQRIPISGQIDDDSRHTGAGLLRSELLRDFLFLDAQGAATLLNTSFAGQIDPDGDDPTQQQTFSASLQPAIRRRIGRLLVNLRYSYGIFEVEGRAPPLRIGSPFTPGRLLLEGASDTRNQSASASIGNAGRSDRLRWRLLADYQRDDIDQLDQRFRSKRGLAEAEYSLSRTIGLIGSVGYEDIRDQQDGILLDATGQPIVDAGGRLQRDPARPIIVNFETSGLTYEGGFRLSPSRRTNLIAKAGRRYGDFTASGSLELQLARGVQLFATYAESINNFGRLFTTLFTDPVSGVVTPISSFAGSGTRTPLGSSTCAFGLDPATGSCRFNLTQLAANATFKDQSAAITIARGSDPMQTGGAAPRFTASASAFYTKRNYLGEQPTGLPAGAAPFSLAGSTDTSYGVSAQGEQQLGSQGSVGFDLRVQRNRYGLSREGSDMLVSAQLRYERLVSRSVELFGTLFAARRSVDNGNADMLSNRLALPERTSGTVSIGLRYLFAPNRGRGSQSSPRPNTPEG